MRGKHEEPEILRYNVPVAGYRKLLIVSSIGLAAIVMALYSVPLVDWYSEQNYPVSAVSGSERNNNNPVSSQNIPTANNSQELLSTIRDQSAAEELQEVATSGKNITLSGWLGNEFGEYFCR